MPLNMGNTSRDLLSLEQKDSSAVSLIDSALVVCNKDTISKKKKRNLHPDDKPVTAPIPRSQVLGKVKDFLGVISEANRKLELDAKDKPKDYDIEVLTGNESECIEMNLMLGVADLNTPEAVAAAESVVSGQQSVIDFPANSSSDSESDDSHIENDTDTDSRDDEQSWIPHKRDNSEFMKQEDCETPSKKKSKKRPCIVEL